MMEWWYILGWIIAAVLALPTAIYYSLRLKSRWGENKEKRRNAIAEAREALVSAIDSAKAYKFAGVFWATLHRRRIDPFTPKKLREDLSQLFTISKECNKWENESWKAVRDRIAAERKDFESLYDFLEVLLGNLDKIFEGRENTLGEGIYKAIYAGNLTFDLARDLILKGRWDKSVTLPGHEDAGGKLKLKDVIEGTDFHKFIEGLKELQDRESIKMLRVLQATFIDRAKAILEEV